MTSDEMKQLRQIADDSIPGMKEAIHICINIIESQQAKIDALMLEFCPDEMTHEQIERWGKHQKRANEQAIAQQDKGKEIKP